MAKKDTKKKKDKKGSGATDPVEAVRSAVERTLNATSEGSAGKRGRDLVDEVAHAAARFRDAMADLKVLDDLKREVESLRARVAALEGKVTTTARSRPAASRSKSTATRSTGTTSTSRSRSAAAKSAGTSRSGSAAAKPAGTSRARSTSSRAKSTGTTRAKSTGRAGTGSTRASSSRARRSSSS
jgi:hypothetical protein